MNIFYSTVSPTQPHSIFHFEKEILDICSSQPVLHMHAHTSVTDEKY